MDKLPTPDIVAQIEAAILAHMNWLVQFQNRLSGIDREPIDPNAVRDDTACALGQWIGVSPDWFVSGPELFRHIAAIHTTFHIVAAELATMIQQNVSRDDIKNQLGELTNLSGQLIAALREAKQTA